MSAVPRDQEVSEDPQRKVDAAVIALRRREAELEEKVKELAEAKRQLEDEQRHRDEFISMVTHELSQPITTLSVAAQLLRRAAVPRESRERAIETMYAQARRLGRLVQDLGDAVRLSAGTFEVFPSRVDLAKLVRDQVEQERLQAPRRRFDVEGASEPVWVEGDSDRIAQVLSNLLTNAVKYAPEGAIHVRLARAGEEVSIVVADEGPGIPPDRIDLVFEPHVRLGGRAGADQPRGSGLGLYIARGIVEAHGGRISAGNGPTGGAIFTVVLPVKAAVRAPGAESLVQRRAG